MNIINSTASARLFMWDNVPDDIQANLLDKLNLVLSDNSNISVEFFGDEPYESDNEKISILTAILDKIVGRGNPTILDKDLEESIIKKLSSFGYSFEDLSKLTNKRIIGKKLINTDDIDDPLKFLHKVKALFSTNFNKNLHNHIIQSQLPDKLKKISSDEENKFYQQFSDKVSPTLHRSLSRQTLIRDLIEFDDEEFIESRVDFSLSCFGKKIVIEIDGIDHRKNKEIRLHDFRRDKILKEHGWEVIRIKTEDVVDNPDKWAEKILLNFQDDINVIQEYDKVFIEEKLDSFEFLAVIYPHVVHKTLKALIHAIRYEEFPINKNEIKLLVMEEETSIVVEALQQLYGLWDNLFTLSNKLPKPPKISVDVVGVNKLITVPKNDNIQINYKSKPETKYDLCISNSFTLITNQEGLVEHKNKELFKTSKYFRIRNTEIEGDQRKLMWSIPEYYDLNDLEVALLKKKEDPKVALPLEKLQAIKYFLQNIFRKYDFWIGQLEVICRLLQGKPTIVLLPTGGGKSLTYQFSGLLLPGLTLIIDPLISLMTDQVENLNLMGFDRATSISSILDADAKEIELEKITNGDYYYVFIAPERLQMQKFRNDLQTLVAQYPISLAVIDEVHCVSEWGHDFRPSYLHLGKNIEKYCTTSNGNKPTLVGLTGTASFAVLTDVQVELNINDEEAIILPKSFDRKELIFHVEKTDVEFKESTFKIIKRRIPQDFRRNPQSFYELKGDQTNAGIIFCPFASSKQQAGVVKVAANSGHQDFYAGSIPNGLDLNNEEWNERKSKLQNDFKRNHVQEIVSTSAFGMGIDKPNIRYIIHYNIPHSVEAYYQEAGRAGRDGMPKSSHCYIIYSDNNWELANEIIREKDHRIANRKLSEISNKNKGDLLVQLWFIFNTYQDRKEEVQNAYDLWRDRLFPSVEKLLYDSSNTVEINYKQMHSKTNIEKGIYRLLLLGLVEEYSIDHRLRKFQVRVKKLQPEAVVMKIREFLLKYKFQEYAIDHTSDISLDNISKTVKQSLEKIVDFVYDEIVEKRKHALRTMAEICRDFDTDEQFRGSILSYLQESEFSETLQAWVNSPYHDIGLDEIEKVVAEVENLEKAKRLVGTARRMLDEDPSNIALRLVSCLARAKSKAESDNSVYQESLNLITQLKEQLEYIPEKNEILIKLVNEIKESRSDISEILIIEILKELGDIDFVRKYLLEHTDEKNPNILENMYAILIAELLAEVKKTNFYKSLLDRR